MGTAELTKFLTQCDLFHDPLCILDLLVHFRCMFLHSYIQLTQEKKMNVRNLFECVHTEIRHIKWVSLVNPLIWGFHMWSKFLELALQELRKLLDHWTTGPLDYWTTRIQDYWTTGLVDYQNKNPADHKPSTSLMMKMRPTWTWIFSAWFDTLFNLTISTFQFTVRFLFFFNFTGLKYRTSELSN